MMKVYTPKQWYSLFDCPSLIIDDQGLIWAADEYYKVLFGSPSGKVDFSAGKIYGKGLGYDLFEEPIAYLSQKNGVTEIRDAKQGIFSAPILYIKDNKIYTLEEYCSIFDAPGGFIRQEKESPFAESGQFASGSAGGAAAGSEGGPVSGLGVLALKIGGVMLTAYCVLIGVANALPIWLSILLGIALIGGLGYMGWFSKDQAKHKAFRLAFWSVLAWFALVAIIIINAL